MTQSGIQAGQVLWVPTHPDRATLAIGAVLHPVTGHYQVGITK